jgi:NAD(P)-dependent dehydrogenase (short-subunit alcohol dehydrogenase family)
MSRVLITGAASGFGQALAGIYAARGDHVLVTDLAGLPDPAWMPSSAASGHVHYQTLDVRDESAWERTRRWIEDEWGELDLLINNAGVAAGGQVDVIPLDDWEWIIEINLMGRLKRLSPALYHRGMKRIGRRLGAKTADPRNRQPHA